MAESKRYHYFVEGKCEKKLIDTLKEQKNQIISGKVEILNVTQELLTELKLRTISDGTIIIFVFDTDTDNIEILSKNIDLIRRSSRFKEVWCVLQVPNLEEELIRSTNIQDVKELLKSKSTKDFKVDFVKEKNLYKKLQEKKFDLNKIWCTKPGNGYKGIENDGKKIKLKI